TSDTIPYNEIYNDNISLEHEAKVSKVSEEQLFYLMSRGLGEQEATDMIVMGFIEPFTKELPMEYAVEMNRLIKYEMEGSAGNKLETLNRPGVPLFYFIEHNQWCEFGAVG